MNSKKFEFFIVFKMAKFLTGISDVLRKGFIFSLVFVFIRVVEDSLLVIVVLIVVVVVIAVIVVVGFIFVAVVGRG